MALAVDAIDGCCPSNEMHCQLQSKKTKVIIISLLYSNTTMHYLQDRAHSF